MAGEPLPQRWREMGRGPSLVCPRCTPPRYVLCAAASCGASLLRFLRAPWQSPDTDELCRALACADACVCAYVCCALWDDTGMVTACRKRRHLSSTLSARLCLETCGQPKRLTNIDVMCVRIEQSSARTLQFLLIYTGGSQTRGPHVARGPINCGLSHTSLFVQLFFFLSAPNAVITC